MFLDTWFKNHVSLYSGMISIQSAVKIRPVVMLSQAKVIGKVHFITKFIDFRFSFAIFCMPFSRSCGEKQV